MGFYIIKKIINFPLIPKKFRVWLKYYLFRKIYARGSADHLSLDMITLLAKAAKQAKSDAGDKMKRLELSLRYKEAALKQFEFVGRPSEFTKGVIYTVFVGLLIRAGPWLISKIKTALAILHLLRL